MPILRSGPFATATQFKEDEPSTPSRFTTPVNCGIYSGSSDWPFRYYFAEAGGSYETASINASQVSESVTGSFIEGDMIAFSYQSVQDITFTGTYNVTATPSQQSDVQFTISTDNPSGPGTVVLFDDRDDSSSLTVGASISGSFSVTLVQTATPKRVLFFVLANGGNGPSATSASITFNLQN
jgi:hypothetical protein